MSSPSSHAPQSIVKRVDYFDRCELSNCVYKYEDMSYSANLWLGSVPLWEEVHDRGEQHG